FDLKVDSSKFPVLVFRYRARGFDPENNWYLWWVDDGTGTRTHPDGKRHGFHTSRHGDALCDGQVHEFRRDASAYHPGPWTGMLIGVSADARGDAELEIFDI